MSYWGTMIVARPHGLLVDREGVRGFGHRHRWLRELGDGWQMLETSGFDDPPDLRGPCEAVAASTGEPVLAAYISDNSCAALVAALPGRVGPLTHLWPVGTTCETYRHEPRGMPALTGRPLDDVIADLAGWSAAAGFRADVNRLRLTIDRDIGQSDSRVTGLLFETVKALGLPRIGRAFPWSLPAFERPFSGLMFSLGPATEAYHNARLREGGVEDIRPLQEWETTALALEAELWSSLYRPDVEVAALARRVERLLAERWARPEATWAFGERPPEETMPSWSEEEVEERRYVDAHATP